MAAGATVDLYTNISISHGIRILGAGNACGNCGMTCRPQVFASASRRPNRSNIADIARRLRPMIAASPERISF